MAQYQVPQFIDIEDRIIGPLTLKQFIYLALAAALLFVFWFIFKFYIWIIIALPVTAMAMAFAFLKINDRPFIHFFLAAVFYFMKPKLYVFEEVPEETGKKEAAPELKPAPVQTPETEKVTMSKLKELALSLDTRK